MKQGGSSNAPASTRASDETCAGDAERVAGVVVVGQHEDVAEQFADRAGFDFAAVRRARVAALRVPIGEETAARWMFHW